MYSQNIRKSFAIIAQKLGLKNILEMKFTVLEPISCVFKITSDLRFCVFQALEFLDNR